MVLLQTFWTTKRVWNCWRLQLQMLATLPKLKLAWMLPLLSSARIRSMTWISRTLTLIPMIGWVTAAALFSLSLFSPSSSTSLNFKLFTKLAAKMIDDNAIESYLLKKILTVYHLFYFTIFVKFIQSLNIAIV